MIGVLGVKVRLTAFPVEGVSETPVTVTLKERIEVPGSSVSVMVRLSVELPPGGGGVPDFDWPLQEVREMVAIKSRQIRTLLRSMGTPRRVKLRAPLIVNAQNRQRNFTARRRWDAL